MAVFLPPRLSAVTSIVLPIVLLARLPAAPPSLPFLGTTATFAKDAMRGEYSSLRVHE